MACHTALIDSATTLPVPSTKASTTSGWVKAAIGPAKSAEASSASEAGTLRTER